MNRLELITDWLKRAQEAGWGVKTLAENCGVSRRTLERHFLKAIHKTPHAWMKAERNKQARAELQAGTDVKQAAQKLGYKNQHHFAREFKKCSGCCPSEYRKGGRAARSG